MSGCTQERSLAHIPLLSPWGWARSLEVPLCCPLIKPSRTLGKKTKQNNQLKKKKTQNQKQKNKPKPKPNNQQEEKLQQN